ncbi:13385_t:CDS:2, partial [Racocetra fulgida]
MHSYSPQSLTDHIYPYYFRAMLEPDNPDVTVAAYITPDRLDDLDVKNFEFPQERQDVKRLVRSRVLGLKDKGWELNNGPTCLSKWMNSDKPYK